MVGLKIRGNTKGKKKITSPEIIRLRRVRNLVVGFKSVGFYFFIIDAISQAEKYIVSF
jgi:hypothetical protein